MNGSSRGPNRSAHRMAKRDADTLHHGDRRLERRVADQVVQRHFQAHAGDQQPGDAERRWDGGMPAAAIPTAVLAARATQKTGGTISPQPRAPASRTRAAVRGARVGMIGQAVRQHHAPVCPKEVNKRFTRRGIVCAFRLSPRRPILPQNIEGNPMPDIQVIATGLRFPGRPGRMKDGSIVLVEIERQTVTRVQPGRPHRGHRRHRRRTERPGDRSGRRVLRLQQRRLPVAAGA